ncbi:hypothetical protein ScPMuIL_001300 [Solemya velum]
MIGLNSKEVWGLTSILLVAVQFFYDCGTIGAVVQVRGAGASFPYAVYKSWAVTYKANRRAHVSLNMSYEVTGSTEGKRRIKAKESLEYAATDKPLTDEEMATHPNLFMFPTMAGSVVIGYNLPGLNETLRLKRDQVVGIFNGTYKYWNESTFSETNPNSTFPNVKITVLARADSSGTTSIFTAALAAFSDEWNTTLGQFPHGKDATGHVEGWPANVITYFGHKTQGVVGLLTSFDNSISYFSVADAEINGVNYAIIENRIGQFQDATPRAVQTAMNGVKIRKSSSMAISLLDSTLKNSYPLASYTYMLVYGEWNNNCQSIKEFVRYVNISITGENQIQECKDAGMVPLSTHMVNVVQESILKIITCGNENVWSLVERDIASEEETQKNWLLPVAIGISLLSVFLCILLGYIIKEKIKVKRILDSNEWEININEITFHTDERNNQSLKSQFSAMGSFISFTPISEIPQGVQLVEQILHWPGKWRTHQVGIRLLYMGGLQNPTFEMKRTMLWMRDNAIHENVVRFYGLTQVDTDRYVIGDYCAKGPLNLILQDMKYNLTDDFKFSVAYNVALGLQFLHSENIIHGNLRSTNCLIDNHWTVKISDWEYFKLSQAGKFAQHPCILFDKNVCDLNIQTLMFSGFWVAPEVLRAKYGILPTNAGDVYSFAIILQEVFTREEPYSEHADIVLPNEIINGILNNNLRPEPTADLPLQVRQIMEIAWSDTPSLRPTIGQVVKMLHRANHRKRSVLDSMIEAMEEYTCYLEGIIEDRSVEMEIVKYNNKKLVSCLRPAHFPSEIIEGLTIKRENVYTSLGVIFVETENIGSFFDGYKPDDSKSIMDKIYTKVDCVCQKYGAHKIAMQNCAFMMIIGLQPEKEQLSSPSLYEQTGDMCLDLISCSFEQITLGCIRFAPKFRISADFGRVVAGVSSTVVPHFLVLGKVFDLTTLLMKFSSGGKIVISSDLYYKLEKCGGRFVTAELEKTTNAFFLIGRKTNPLSPKCGTVQEVSSGTESESPTSLCQVPEGKHVTARIRRTNCKQFENKETQTFPNANESMIVPRILQRTNMTLKRNGKRNSNQFSLPSSRLSKIHPA